MLDLIYTNKTTVNNMAEIIAPKKHLLVKKAKIIKFLKSEGYNGQEIGYIMNLDRSQISRIISASNKYKITIEKVLKS